MLEPLNVSTPVPNLVMLLVEIAITPLIVVLPEPVTSMILVPETPPVARVRVPLSDSIVVALSNVIAPCHSLLPLMFLKAPVLDIPDPLRERASLPTVMPP